MPGGGVSGSGRLAAPWCGEGGAIRTCPPPGRNFVRPVSLPFVSSVMPYVATSPSFNDTYTPFHPSGVFSARRSTPVSHPLEQRNEVITATSWNDLFRTSQPSPEDGVPAISPFSTRQVALPSLCHALRSLALTGSSPWCL